MAVSDMVYGSGLKNNGQKLDITPSTSGVEWVIHNIYIPLGSTCAVYRYIDGTNDILMHNISYSIGNLDYHCNNSSFIYVKNNGSSTVCIGYDGMVSGT